MLRILLKTLYRIIIRIMSGIAIVKIEHDAQDCSKFSDYLHCVCCWLHVFDSTLAYYRHNYVDYSTTYHTPN